MASVFGPIECHHLVSFYRKKDNFSPLGTRLKKSFINRIPVSVGADPCFMNMLDLAFCHTSSGGAAKRLCSPNLSYMSLPYLMEINSLEFLLRRGLGYRIIFNMGGKVYNPEDPSTLPDVTLVLTDSTGNQNHGCMSFDQSQITKSQGKTQVSWNSFSGCDSVQAAFTFDRVVITRDGKVELEFFHFDKLLSPEQLKIYNKYASVLGEYLTIEESCSNPLSTQAIFARFFDHLLGSAIQIEEFLQGGPKNDSEASQIRAFQQKLQTLQTEILPPLEAWAGEKDYLDLLETLENVSTACSTCERVLEARIRRPNPNTSTKTSTKKHKHQLAATLDPAIKAFCRDVLDERPDQVGRILQKHFRRMDDLRRFAVERAFCCSGRSGLRALVRDAFKNWRYCGGPDEVNVEISSVLCDTVKYRVLVRNNVLRVTQRGGPGGFVVEIALTEEMCGAETEPAMLADGNGTDTLDDLVEEYDESLTHQRKINSGKYGYRLTPLKGNSILMFSKNFVNFDWLRIDLDRLWEMKQATKESISETDIWADCSIKISRPVEDEFYQSSRQLIDFTCKTTIVALAFEGFQTKSRIALYYLDIKRRKYFHKWLAVGVPNTESFWIDFSYEASAIYYSETQKLIFVSVRNTEKPVGLRYKLITYRPEPSIPELSLITTSDFQTDTISASDDSLNPYWIEKKGKAFFYCVQSSPEIKLLVICYHNSQFLPLGKQDGFFRLSSQLKCSPIYSAQDIVGAVFRHRRTRSWGEFTYFNFYLLTPDF